MIDDAVMPGEVNHVHWDELGAEREDVEVCPHRLVLMQDVRDSFSFLPPAIHLEHIHPILRGDLG